MFRRVVKKDCLQLKPAGSNAAGFVSLQLLDSFSLSIIPKQINFDFKPVTFSCIAAFVRTLCFPPCIGATVPLYSGALFGH
jgi:hypothetical protein